MQDVMIVPADPRYPLEKRPLITNEMKADAIGEFSITVEESCSACYFHVPQDDCEVCQGEVEYTRTVQVPWDTCKEIYKRMTQSAAAGMVHNA